MRKRMAGLSSIIFVLLLLCSCGGNTSSNDNTRTPLSESENSDSKGTEEIFASGDDLLLRTVQYDKNGEMSLTTQYRYDANGKIESEAYTIGLPQSVIDDFKKYGTPYYDQPGFVLTYEYDDNGNPISSTNSGTNISGELTGGSAHYTYDNNGNMLSMCQYDETGNLISMQKWSYNDHNDIYVHLESLDGVITRRYEEYSYEYNDNGQKTLSTLLYKYYNKDGSLNGEYTEDTKYEYNKNGLIEKEFTEKATTTYEYDARGNLVKETYYEDGNITRWIEYEYFSRKDLISQSFDLTILPDDRNRETAETLIAEMESHYKENGWTAGMIGRCDCENETLSQGYAFYLRDNTTGEIDNSGYFYVVPSTKTIYRIWETEFWIEWMNGLPNQEGNAKELVSSLVNMEPSFSEVNGDRYLILCGEYWFEVSWDCSTVWYVTEPYSDDKGIEIYPNDTNGFLENYHAQSSGTISNNGSQSISTGYTAYDAKIAEYVAATSDADLFFDKYSGDDSSLNSLILGYYHNYSGMTITYALYDVDGNGIPELAFSDTFGIIDIYTLNGDALVKLYENCSFGERSRLHILSGGRLLTEGSNSASSSSCELSIFSSTGTSLLTQEAYYYDGNGKNPSMDATHTYLTGTDYGNKVNTWLEDSLFDELPWIVIASN